MRYPGFFFWTASLILMNGMGESIEIECLTELNSLIIDKNDQENKLNYFSLYLTFDFIAYLLRRKVTCIGQT